MQKTLRINLLARNQAVRRARKDKAKENYKEWQEFKQQDIAQERRMRSYVKEERAHRREDWKLGPLAPNRDAGKQKEKFGALDFDVIYSPELPKAVRQTPRLPGYNKLSTEEVDVRYPRFKGRTIVGNVVEGDRVVIVHGPQRLRGLIGIVGSVELDREDLKINNVNVTDVTKPAHLVPEPTEQNPYPEKIATIEGWIPMRNVRLVVRDERSGKEFIVSNVHADGPYIQQKFGSQLPSHTRYITGSEQWSEDGLPVEIPWPEDQTTDDVRSTPADTGRMEVEERTWMPSMYYSPLGYKIDPSEDTSKPTTAYLAGYQNNASYSPTQLHALGLAGFSSSTKADDRQARIAGGIMDELRKKNARSNRNHDDPEWVKQKIVEDARSIWWKHRQLKTPQEIKAELKLEAAQEEREAKMRAASEAAVLTQDNLQPGQKLQPILDAKTKEIIQNAQKVALRSVYDKPDRKFRRKLEQIFPPKPDDEPLNELSA